MSKIVGEYAQQIPSKEYDRTPKAVLAALVVSACNNGGLCGQEECASQSAVWESIVKEWAHLHEMGLIPQRPPKLVGARGGGA